MVRVPGAEIDARDPAHREEEIKTKLLEVLVALHAEITSVANHIWHHDAVWTARRWGVVIAREKGRVHPLNRKLWLAQ